MTATDPPAGTWTLRPATPEDLSDLSVLVPLSRSAALGHMPAAPVGPAAQRARVLAWAETWDTEHEVWVAQTPGGELVGVARFTATWLEDLYVHPAASGQGIATALVELVQALRPSGFGLWVFATNQPARALYARLGLVEVGRTDGSQNEERAPELELSWAGSVCR